MYYWKSTNSSAFRKQRPKVSLLWIFNLKKSSKQWTEFIRFGVRSFFFYFLESQNYASPFPCAKNNSAGKKDWQWTYKISEYKYTNFISPWPELYILSNPELEKTWRVINNTILGSVIWQIPQVNRTNFSQGYGSL